MRVMVKISDDQVVEFLRDCIHVALSRNELRTKLDRVNFIDALEVCFTMNRVIKYLGGQPVDLAEP